MARNKFHPYNKLVERGVKDVNHPVVDSCLEKGECSKISGDVCSIYLYPNMKWRNGHCPMATNLFTAEERKAMEQKANPYTVRRKFRGRR